METNCKLVLCIYLNCDKRWFNPSLRYDCSFFRWIMSCVYNGFFILYVWVRHSIIGSLELACSQTQCNVGKNTKPNWQCHKHDAIKHKPISVNAQVVQYILSWAEYALIACNLFCCALHAVVVACTPNIGKAGPHRVPHKACIREWLYVDRDVFQIDHKST